MLEYNGKNFDTGEESALLLESVHVLTESLRTGTSPSPAPDLLEVAEAVVTPAISSASPYAGPYVQSLYNGFTSPDVLTSGPIYVEDYAGNLVSAGINERALPGMHWESPSWYDTDSEGNLLFPRKCVRTRLGNINIYGGAYEGMAVAPSRTNLLYPSEPTVAQILIRTAGITADIGFNGLLRSVRFPANGAQEFACLTHGNLSANVGQAYTFSIYIEMLDGLGIPILTQTTNGTSDFLIAVQNLTSGISVSVDYIGGNVFRVVGQSTLTTATSGVVGILREYSNRQRTFRIAGYQFEPGASSSPYIPTTTVTVTRAATVATFNSENRLSAQNCAVWGRVIPGAAGQSEASLFAMYTSAINYIKLTANTSVLRLVKRFNSPTSQVATASYPHTAGTPFEYQFAWTDQGMILRVKEDGAAWGAWVSNPDANQVIVPSTFNLGSSYLGVAQFAGTYPLFATAYLPTQSTLAGYQAWIESDPEWNRLANLN
jgi:hypothetical protein